MLLAAIPFFELRVWNVAIPGLGTLPVDPWATLVCIGFVVGLEIARNRAIKLGMIASLALASATNEAVPVVPLNAIVRSKEEPDQYSLFVIEVQGATESARLRSVTLGEAFGNRVAVMSGVKVGDRVITSGGSRLVDGQAVQVIP